VPDIEFIIELSQIMQIVRVRLVSVHGGSARLGAVAHCLLTLMWRPEWALGVLSSRSGR
jgi:hypothetical protein